MDTKIGCFIKPEVVMQRRKFSREFKVEAVRLVRERGVSVAQVGRNLVPGITNRYCGHPSRRPLRGLLRMRSDLLKHDNLMLRSERRERLEVSTASDLHISPS
jgi:hypothetical protein